MDSELNKKLIVTILKHISENKKPVNYLVNALSISRESAYRRIRGDIPFTVQELVTLVADLGFSIDVIFEQEKQNRSFYDYSRNEKNPSDFFVLMLKKYSELLEKISFSKKLDTIMAFNSFPPPFYAGYYNLFKFSYYKWLYQDKEIMRNESYSNLILPDMAFVYQRKMRENLIQGKNTILILDTNIFLNLIKEVQYFYNRKLLTNEEVLLIKEDTIRMIEQFEESTQTGDFGSAKVQLYLSPLCVSSNTIYYKLDDKAEPLFWLFTINPVIIQNTGLVSMQIKWLNSLKRQSALITQSNEIMQAEFFFKQREYINMFLSIDSSV